MTGPLCPACVALSLGVDRPVTVSALLCDRNVCKHMQDTRVCVCVCVCVRDPKGGAGAGARVGVCVTDP